ncbi:MAG TPA: PilZ domain-containing protein, partial [Candidatus Methylomirabilis sp.]|nr:PilZ domain-containing protein [Candidatus Methylomirabilis sp.]
TSFDISPGGIFVRTDQVLPTGQSLLVRFTLPGVDHTFKAVGQVIWSSPNEMGGHPAGMGVEFLDMAEDEQAAILQYIVDTMVAQALAAEPEP